MKKIFILASFSWMVVWAGPVNAETAAAFLKSLEGNYSGRGSAEIVGKQKTKIACKIKSDFSQNNSKLTLSGQCASTKGKGEINGGITAKDNTIAGTFVSPKQGVKVTRSSGRFASGKLTLSASMFDEKAGKLIKVRQVISKLKNGISAKFFTYDNASKTYKQSGSLKLKKL